MSEEDAPTRGFSTIFYSYSVQCTAYTVLQCPPAYSLLYFTLIHCSALYTLQCIILHHTAHAYLWPLHILHCLAACSYPGQLHLISLCSIQTKRKQKWEKVGIWEPSFCFFSGQDSEKYSKGCIFLENFM